MVSIAGLCQRVECSGVEEVPGPVCEDVLLEGQILHISKPEVGCPKGVCDSSLEPGENLHSVKNVEIRGS